MAQIKMIIGKDGTTRMEVIGADGGTCLEKTRSFEEALGTQVGERVLKPEFHETVHATETEFEVEL